MLIVGTAAPDTLQGGLENDTIFGNEGNDVMVGRAGNDYFVGGAGDDEIRDLNFINPVTGGGRADETGGTISFLDEEGGRDTLLGNGGNDRLFGDSGNDVIFGGQGNDILDGDLGDDFISGDMGNDILTGCSGNDTFALRSGGGADRITDFVDGQDRFALQFGLQFSALGFQAIGNAVQINIAATGEVLAIVDGLANPAALTVQDFVTVEGYGAVV